MEDLEWEQTKWRVAWEEPLRYLLEDVAPDALSLVDAGLIEPEIVLASIARAFEGLSVTEFWREVGPAIAPRWLKYLEAGDWGAHESFRRRWDMWEYLAAERGVTFPAPYSEWSNGSDGRAPVLPSLRTVERRLAALGIDRPSGASEGRISTPH
jgi:hypothetical protein